MLCLHLHSLLHFHFHFSTTPPPTPQSWRYTDVNMTHDAAQANGTSILNSSIGATVESMANGSWYKRNSSLVNNGLITNWSSLKYEGQRTWDRGCWTLNSPSCRRKLSCLMGIQGGFVMMCTSGRRMEGKHPSMPPSKKCHRERWISGWAFGRCGESKALPNPKRNIMFVALPNYMYLIVTGERPRVMHIFRASSH